jgi:hypothetical protein
MPGDEEGKMARPNSRAGLEEWFVTVDRLLEEEREHAISPSTVPPATDDTVVWTMRLSTFHRDLVALIDLLVSSPGRWIFFLEPSGSDRYLQMVVYEDGSIFAEAVANDFLEGPDRLSAEQETELSAIGWSEPCLRGNSNWWAVEATIYPDTSKLARLVLGTLESVYGLCGTDLVTGKLFDSPQRGDTPASSMSYPSSSLIAPVEGRQAAMQYGWSDAFHRSRLSPVVFVIAKDFVDPVLEVLAVNSVPLVSRSPKSENSYTSAALLDGLIIHVHAHGFPAGQLPSGWRVLGCRPMRLLCLLMEVEAPRRRLRGEDLVATEEDLLEALAWQLEEPRAQLRRQAKRGLGIADRVELLVLVRELFGEEDLSLPQESDLKALLRAVSQVVRALTVHREDAASDADRGVEMVLRVQREDAAWSYDEMVEIRPLVANGYGVQYRPVVPQLRDCVRQ